MPDPVLVFRSSSTEAVGYPQTPQWGDVVVIRSGQNTLTMPWTEFCALVAEASRKLGLGQASSGVGAPPNEDFG